MRDPLRGEAAVDTDDGELVLIVDNAALVAVEQLIDVSFLEVAQHLLEREASGRPAKLEIMQGLLWAALRRRHADYTPAHCGDLLLREGERVRPALINALVGALPRKDDASGEAKAPVTMPADGIGTGSPADGSKPAVT
ncbi:MAG TPA: hypothetical protein VF695_13820 [Sphingomonas sp.]|jgi:hypothetical protein